MGTRAARSEPPPAVGRPHRPGRLFAPHLNRSPRARLAGFSAVGALAVVVCVRVYLVDPAEPGHYPSCPFRALTTWDCPGCGSLRGLHQLLHGHPLVAADHNLFLVLAVPGLVLGWLIAMARCAGWRRRVPMLPARLLPLLPTLIAVFWVARNLPGPVGSWLASPA